MMQAAPTGERHPPFASPLPGRSMAGRSDFAASAGRGTCMNYIRRLETLRKSASRENGPCAPDFFDVAACPA